MSEELLTLKYSAIGDIATVCICLLLIVILKSTYCQKSKRYRLLHSAIGLLVIACLTRLTYMELLKNNTITYKFLILTGRTLYYATLSIILILYMIYIMELVGTLKGIQKVFKGGAGFGFLVYSISVHILIAYEKEFHIDANGAIHQTVRAETFYYYYAYMIILITLALFICKKRLITKVRLAIFLTMAIAVGTVASQIYYTNTSLLSFTFSLPFITVCFMFHNEGHDIETGSLSYRSFLALYNDKKTEKRCFISLYLEDLRPEKAAQMSEHFYHFNEGFFRSSTVFQLDDHRFLMLCSKRRNNSFEELMPDVLMAFQELYKSYQIDYRILWGEIEGELDTAQEFYQFLVHQEKKMKINSNRKVEKEWYLEYEKINYIIHQLLEIDSKKDLNDSRVKVFCQPVLNTSTNKFTTAEALMRFETEKYGMIFPDVFIPLAENYGVIHTLTEIILNKTCKFLKEMMEEGKDIDRISVNVSTVELKNKYFCQDIIRIIENNHVPFEKIAIEITESTNEADFQMIKDIMFELQKYGIKFYLDDFGTGYSNIERIIGLPIDIIKFDRSLTILSGKNETTKSIVSNISKIFEMAQYQILFEGIEDDADEKRCLEMKAEYLQGFKYSKPIPIQELKNFI